MKELTLQELKDVEFDILKVFVEFCKENNIKYYLSHGTLLGAIRYKKFIPWDDDVDLLIPREDYERMLKLFKDTDRYKLFSYERNKDYRFPYAKLCDMNTRKVEFGQNNGVELGLDIDLFPLDYWDNDLERAKKEVKSIKRNLSFLLLAKSPKINEPNKIKALIKRVLSVFCKIAGSQYFIKRIDKISKNPKCIGSKYRGCKAWCVYNERGIIPAEVFDETANIEFEGEYFIAPKDYDTYLTCLYGDYLPEPPIEKQKTHHTFTAYKI